MDDEFPEDELSEKLARLGDPLGEFTVGRRTLWLFVIGGPCLTLAGLGVFYLMVDQGVWHPKALVFALVLAIAGVVLMIRARRMRGVQVLVFPEGLIRMQGERAHALFWDEVDAVFWKTNSNIWSQMAAGSNV